MDLKTFLAQSSTSTDDATALTQAQAHTETQGQFISSDRLTMMLVGAGLYSVFHDTANNTSDAARDICLGLMARLGTSSDFNFIQGDPNGDANLAMIDDLINSKMTAHATALSALQSQIIAEANQTVTPFANATLYDVMLTRDNCPTKPVNASNGFVTITTTKATPKHNPRLLALNPRTSKWLRVNNFYNVEAAGKYDAAVPPEWAGCQLAVDDPYGAV